MKRTAFLLILDVSMLVLVCVLETINLTGMTLHEWLGFLLCPLVLVHVVLQWSWFATQFRKIWTPGANRVRVNALLNVLLMIAMAATLISGVVNSNQVYPWLGERLGRSWVWQWVHDSANGAVMVLVGLHLGLNWNWMVAALRRKSPKTPATEMESPQKVEISRRSRRSDMGKMLMRGLAVFVIAWLMALAVYAAFAPFVGLSREERFAQMAKNEPGKPTPGKQKATARFQRLISVSQGSAKLAQLFLIVLVLALAGRYVLRLRL